MNTFVVTKNSNLLEKNYKIGKLYVFEFVYLLSN